MHLYDCTDHLPQGPIEQWGARGKLPKVQVCSTNCAAGKRGRPRTRRTHRDVRRCRSAIRLTEETVDEIQVSINQITAFLSKSSRISATHDHTLAGFCFCAGYYCAKGWKCGACRQSP